MMSESKVPFASAGIGVPFCVRGILDMERFEWDESEDMHCCIFARRARKRRISFLLLV